ncbi:MAG: anti-sigma factor [Bacteroidota bacterium]
MDIKKYIESGILEQYITGLLPKELQKEVEQNALQYPEIKAELDQIEDALELYGAANAINPPSHIEAAILSRIDASGNDTSSNKKNNNGGFKHYFGTGLLIIATGVTLIWASSLNSQLNNVKKELIQVQENYTSLEQDCLLERQGKEKTEIIIALYKDPGTRPIRLAGTEKAPQASASMLWNPSKQQSFLETSDLLPIGDPNKQYQLWAIVDGTPINMGVFDLAIDNDTFIEVPFIDSPQAFAITLENKGGSPSPTLEEMVVIGNVS